MSSSPERRPMGIMEVESVLNRSLRNENDLLRCQLNDLIHREKTQRIELQRLRQRRDAEITSMVNSGTSHLKAEVKQLQNMLQSTSEQLLQTLGEREQARGQKEQLARALEELRRTSSTQEHQLQQRLQSLEEAFTNGVNAVATLADSVDAFQRHVLPTFKPSEFEMNKGHLKVAALNGTVEGQSLMEQLTRLENGLALLRVIVDAKNDTLVLIRGKLKQENEELRAELQIAQDTTQGSDIQPQRTTPPSFDSTCTEKNLLRQELLSLQNIFNEEVKQLKSKLKIYESEEQQGQGHLFEVQKELVALQNKLGSVEASRALLEASLKEETAARSQLLSQLFTLRKVGDTELASKLARARLQQLGMQESQTNSSTTTPQSANDLCCSPVLKPSAPSTCSPMMQTEYFHSNGLQGTQSIEVPMRDEIMSSCGGFYTNPRNG